MQRLLENGADVTVATSRGCLALCMAAEDGNTEVLSLLCKSHIAQDQDDIAPFQQAWMAAARNGHADAMRTLMGGLDTARQEQLLYHGDD